MVFNKKRANDRKEWLSKYDRESYLNTSKNNDMYPSVSLTYSPLSLSINNLENVDWLSTYTGSIVINIPFFLRYFFAFFISIVASSSLKWWITPNEITKSNELSDNVFILSVILAQ